MFLTGLWHDEQIGKYLLSGSTFKFVTKPSPVTLNFEIFTRLKRNKFCILMVDICFPHLGYTVFLVKINITNGLIDVHFYFKLFLLPTNS